MFYTTKVGFQSALKQSVQREHDSRIQAKMMQQNTIHKQDKTISITTYLTTEILSE